MRNGSPAKRLGIIVFGLVFMAIGGLVLKIGYGNIREGLDSESWPKVDGVVISSDYTTNVPTSSTGNKKTTYMPHVTYKYKVDGNEYVGERISFQNQSSSDYSEIKQYVKEHHAGYKVSVFYNPSKPSLAVLENGVRANAYYQVIAGLVFAIAGLAVLYLSRYA